MNFLALRLEKSVQSSHIMSSNYLSLRTSSAVCRCLVQRLVSVRPMHANRTSVCKIARQQYCRLYKVLLVYPDGSTVTVRHPEPQALIQLPVLYEDCKTEAQRKAWLMRRKKIEKVQTEEEIDLKYNQKQYLNIFKKKSRA